MKVEPSPIVLQASIPFWMIRSAANTDVVRLKRRTKIPRVRLLFTYWLLSEVGRFAAYD
jgi:hypothetical protein